MGSVSRSKRAPGSVRPAAVVLLIPQLVRRRGKEREKETGEDDGLTVRHATSDEDVDRALISIRRVVVERRRVRAEPAALAQVDAFFGG